MTDEYFGGDDSARSDGGRWVQWDAQTPIEMVPGLGFQPVLGGELMLNVVTFAPGAEAPVHWHDEEQITFVVEGEIEFTLGNETRTVGRGQAAVIPPNVPHGARALVGPAVAIDAFHPPRQGIVDAMPPSGRT
jgi:quercetin dioxygenase-like cupin family protein